MILQLLIMSGLKVMFKSSLSVNSSLHWCFHLSSHRSTDHIFEPGSSTVHLLILSLLRREEIVVDSPVNFQWQAPLKINFHPFHLCLLSHILNTMTSQNSIILNTPDNPPHPEWVEREWIGKGKKYPISSEVPAFIEAAHSQVLAVPPACLSYIPSKRISITDLLKANLPTQSSTLIMHTAVGAFSKEEPNEKLTCLKTHSIPPKDWLEMLEKNFGQAWFNSAWSIKDKRFKNSQLPLLCYHTGKR